MPKLVIVESPGKLKKLRAILGAGYRVEASVGHVRDLPRKEMGVEPPAFRPNYVKTERGADVLKKLQAAVNACGEVLLASDPDREGEAIAWHLADALNLKNPKRVTFHAIANDEVLAGVSAPRQIDMHLVHAQEARRVLDRLVGYTVSPLLSSEVGHTLSAGRVQSPAVRIVVERERAIRNFKPTKHFTAVLHFGGGWFAEWDTKPYLPEGQEYFTDRVFAEDVAKVRDVIVTACEDGRSKAAPPAPFTTSTLQKSGQTRLKLKPKATMELAQKLYEQGAITYHRTDNPNLSPEGYAQLRSYAAQAGITLADKQRTWKAKEGAQEAHEAIRPTHFDVREAGESPEQKALYNLIWLRAVASQMPDAVFAVRTVKLATKEPVRGQKIALIARGKTLIEKGWKDLYEAQEDDEADGEGDTKADNPVPKLAVGRAGRAASGEVKDMQTKPPKRFKQATLIEELERLEIGRPSTYAAILDNITSREYIIEDKKGFLSPGLDGETVVDKLVGKCQFIELGYTRDLESSLDAIASGKTAYLPVVTSAWEQLASEVSGLGGGDGKLHACPECGSAMRRIKGKSGFFWGCTGYPKCKTSLPDRDGAPGERTAASTSIVSTEHKCADCGKPLAHRVGEGRKGHYDFWGCTGYPKCNTTYKSSPEGAPIIPAPRAAAA